MLILAILAYLWPVFDQLQLRCLCWTFQMSIFFIILIILSEIDNILINQEILDKNADFGHFGSFWPVFDLFLTCFGPGKYVKRSQQVFLS